MNRMRKLVSIATRPIALCTAVVVPGIFLSPARSTAQTVTLTDGGSAATINLSSSAGMNGWNVGGQNQLNQQWFWYRTSSSSGIAAINTIGTPTYTLYGNNEVSATYQNSQLSLNIDYVLSGGGVGSGSASMTETIAILNTSSTTSLPISFFEYSNFNLLQNNANSVTMFGSAGAWSGVQQTTGSTAIQEAVLSPFATHGETALIGLGGTLSEFETNPNYNLNDNASAGPGNVTWALQWDATIGPNGELDIFKDKTLSIQTMTPEPSTYALVCLGLGVWGFVRRRKSS
jgi:PEP-CTERM motif